MADAKQILVTGATGYIGGRLVPQLLEKGYQVRCLARDPSRLSGRGWDEDERVEFVVGDVLEPASLGPAMAGCDAAYYLVHSMSSGAGRFEDRDRLGATNFAKAAGSAGLGRLIYLGGLGDRSGPLSAHLDSRNEVGDVLRAGKTPVTELRAAMVIGSGSASFEMLRALVKKLPIMICPRWVETKTQPIAVRDILAYLIGALESPAVVGGTFDVGGPEVLTFREMIVRFAAVIGLKRRIISIPVLTPRLSAYWVNLMTPVPAGLAFALIESLKTETVCGEHDIRTLIPITPTGFDDAVRWAIDKVNQHAVETRWTNASVPRGSPWRGPSAVVGSHDRGPTLAEFPLNDSQTVEVDAPSNVLFDRVRRIGGSVGWYYADFLWKIRGAMDRAIGGVGLRRGRRDDVSIRIGDALDFWRVADVAPGRRLLLHAEMIVPGDAWLEFRVEPLTPTRSRLVQTAFFKPSPRFWGRAYWYACYPLHWFVFAGMARGIARAAEGAAQAQPVSTGKT